MTPAQLSDAIVAALDRTGRGGHAAPARRRAQRGGRGASAEQGARRLRDQRRAAAGQEGGHAAARARPVPGRGAGRDRRHRQGRHRRAGLPEHHRLRRRPGQGGRRRGRRRCVVRRAATTFAGEKINLEFVSANPTGPLHLGGIRWAAVGDALARVFDDDRRRGRARVLLQRPRRPDRPVRRLAAAPAPRVEPIPEDGYGGQYIDDIAARSSRSSRGSLDLPEGERAGGLPRRRRTS